MKTTSIAALLLAGLLTPSLAPALTLDVRDCGAIGDGSHLDTQAIQTAIDRCATAGGGTVLLQTGRFLSGTIFLKSRVFLQLAGDSTRNIALTANDLSAVGRPLDLAPEVPQKAVTSK
jgi:polygalacturonase